LERPKTKKPREREEGRRKEVGKKTRDWMTEEQRWSEA